MKEKTKKLIESKAETIRNTYKDSKHFEFVGDVINLLLQGEWDIPIHPEICTDSVWWEYINVSDFNQEHAEKRKICKEIGEILGIKTSYIYGKCGKYIGCNDERWGEGNFCKCESGVPNDFWCYHYENNYEDTESFSIYPWIMKVGVRFYPEGETQDHKLTGFFEKLGPFPCW